MAISSETLNSIQRAGSALLDAQQRLAEEVGQQARQVSEAMAADPFNIASDDQFESWKTMARMARSIGAMEEQLRSIYFAAVELHGGKRLAQPLALGLDPVSQEHVIDAEGPAPTASRRRKASKQSSDASAPGVVGLTSRLRGNAAAALSFLKTRLGTSGFERVTHAELASGATIALGSVGFALASLKSKGLLAEGERGHYRLLNG